MGVDNTAKIFFGIEIKMNDEIQIEKEDILEYLREQSFEFMKHPRWDLECYGDSLSGNIEYGIALKSADTEWCEDVTKVINESVDSSEVLNLKKFCEFAGILWHEPKWILAHHIW